MRDDEGRPLPATTIDLGSERTINARPADSLHAPSPFDRKGDRFETRGELGRGGMGRVEAAFDRALERPVAIKQALQLSEIDLARFAREVRITARLEHPGIVPVHDAGRSPDGTPYYVMRRIDGRPLTELVANATASFAERLALIPNVLAACDAVAFAHARGVVHRDLKPENILIGPFGETLVIDWGLAREIDPDAAVSGNALAVARDGLTAAGTVAGTPGFMAPEQARGESVDARADVFALGATLFYVLAGVPLYESTSATELVDFAGLGREPDWRRLPPRVPADLRAILKKALASDPAARYRDAGAFAGDLRRFVTGNLVAAREYGALDRFMRFVRRHRAAVAVAAASALVLAVFAVVSIRRIVAERDDANTARTVAETRQREARDAADHLLVQRAKELAATDPLATIALLRQLPPDSARWRDAWLAAAAAWTHGIPFGFHGEHKVIWLQISGDNRRAVTTSTSGAIVVYDLEHRTRRTVAHLARAHMCQWIGEQRLLCTVGDEQIVLLDTERGTTRTLPGTATYMISDRRSRALIETGDNRVIEISGPDGTARLIASGVELTGASPDLGEVAWWRGDALELWNGTRALPVARFSQHHPSSMVEIRDHVLAAIVGSTTYRWHVAGDLVVEDGHWPRGEAGQVMIAAGHLFALGRDEVRGVDVDLRLDTKRPTWLFATPLGIAVVQYDGSIGLYDRDGWFELGPYATGLERGDLSLDGRFLVAVTDADDVVVWNIAEQRPRTSYIPAAAEPILLRPPYLWLRDMPRGIVRRELGKDTDEVVLPGSVPNMPGLWLDVAEDGRWAAVREPQTDRLRIFDAIRGERGTIGDVVAQVEDADGLVVARRDGVLARWTPGGGAATELVRLPRVPAGFTVAGPYVVAASDPRTLVRITTTTHVRADATLAEPLHDLALARDGRTWIVAESGTLWRWDLDAAPVRVALAEPIDQIVTTGGRILAHTARSLIVLDADPPRAVPIDSRATSWMGDDYIATLSPHGAVSIVDLATGSSITLPETAGTQALVAAPDMLVYATSRGDGATWRLATISLPVPHGPDALQRWLRDVTNARPAESGVGGVWP